MNVLIEIVTWSDSRPTWQRDALRRLITKGTIDQSDLTELTELCKAAHGLAPAREATPLDRTHVPTRRNEFAAVTLTALTHHDGVNALARNQTISFGPAVTIVYGDNASGKSGYTRILKSACRARGSEAILGNVLVTDTAPSRQSATIQLSIGDRPEEFKWEGATNTHEALGHISVFDSHSAAVYLREKTDVPFRPFGLDLFDKLAKICEAVNRSITSEQAQLNALQPALPQLPEGTVAHAIASRLTTLTNTDELRALGTLSDIERDRLRAIEQQLRDLESEDSRKTAQMLNLRAARLERLIAHIVMLTDALSNDTLSGLFGARAREAETGRSALTLRQSAFPAEVLSGTGSRLWRVLWEAARQFSREEAYLDHPFPHTDSARCVLCQQTLEEAAKERLQHFERFVTSTIQQEHAEATAEFKRRHDSVASLPTDDGEVVGVLEELQLEAADLAQSTGEALRESRKRRDLSLTALANGTEWPSDLPEVRTDTERLQAEVRRLRARVGELTRPRDEKAMVMLGKELAELRAREILGNKIELFIAEIERLRRLSAYRSCLADTNTTGITRKSTDVTERVVTQQLVSAFTDELRASEFTHLEVELRSAGGERGALYHKLAFSRAANVDLPKVVSEGEARCLSIMAFLAELTTISDRSAILFDDPVSSLDHHWRRYVARRLVEEAKKRQVIIFTHDVVFLLAVLKAAESLEVACHHQELRREDFGSGVASPSLPWIAMPVKERIAQLRRMHQEAAGVHRRSRAEYEAKAKEIYELLREAWERGIEEVLIGGVVERYRHSIESRRAKHLSDITPGDCAALEAGMTKASNVLHDRAAADHSTMPGPEELLRDIDALDEWRMAIVRRRS